MSNLCFAILAHNNRECLADQVRNLQIFSPGARIVLYNGGTDTALADDLKVEVCPYSMPLCHSKVTYFQRDIMQWLYETDRLCDFLICLDSDMLLIKPGLDFYLEKIMAQSSYMGTNFQEVVPGTPWDIGRRFHYKWQNGWQTIFGIPNPFGCFNPAQTFRWTYIERFVHFPKLQELFQKVKRTRLGSTEEIIYPTLAVSMACSPISNPGSKAMQLRRHSPLEIQAYIADPDVFFLHKVGMEFDAHDRKIIRALSAGESIDFNAIDTSYLQQQTGKKLPRKSYVWLIDLYSYIRPEEKRVPHHGSTRWH